MSVNSAMSLSNKVTLPALAGQRWISPLVLILLWEAGSRAGLIPSHILAAPSAVISDGWDMIVSGELPANMLVSLGRAMAGLALGVGLGSALAIAAGLTRAGESALDPPIQMLRTLPSLALTPLFIVWFGIGETPKVALITLGTLFPIYLNLFNGIRGVDPKLVEAARSFGLRGWDLVVHVILPGALPSFLLGLRFALAGSWLILVVAEQINASAGLGYLINNARDFSRTDTIVVCLIVYALLGLSADAIVRALERRALAWRPSFIKS
ncbi:MAG: transporter permease [Caulobacteraceae bacterium]|nr:transporter permease [Caulobacteraceae bacterium]